MVIVICSLLVGVIFLFRLLVSVGMVVIIVRVRLVMVD